MPDLSAYDQVFEDAGREWNVDPKLLKAMATQESGGNPRAVSKAGAQGLMQIMPATAKSLGMTDPTDPVQSIYGAAKYMNEALDKEGSAEGALLYYHGGPGWRQAYGPESKGYVPAVTAHYRALTQGQGAAQPPAAESPPAPAQQPPTPTTPTVAASPFGPGAFVAQTAPQPAVAPPASTQASAPPPTAQPPVAASGGQQDGSPLIIGDSLASKDGLGGSGVVGASPKAVLSSINALSPDEVRGRDVVLSSGASNNPAQASLVYEQIQALKKKGAGNVTVVGVGDRPDFAGVNDTLELVTGRAGGRFVALPAGSLRRDRVHPTHGGYNALLYSVLPTKVASR
jgi:hypothetical protein